MVVLEAKRTSDAEGGWARLAILQASTTPLVLADRSTVYEWQTEVVPATAGSQAWPQGGLARVRAQIANTQLPVYAADADACLASAATVQAQIEKCAYRVVDGAVLVSSGTTSETAAQNPLRPLYLARKGVGSEAETELYYTATNASPTLAAFRTRFGFTGTAPTEAQAAYLNRGDLEVGRDMHCNTFAVGNEQGLACYSSNYGAFSGDPTTNLDLAVAGFRAGNGAGAFATVTMVYTPPIDAPNAVAFAVYNAAGNRVNSAQLDRFGDSVGIPHNCLNCHGSASTYDTTTHAASNARFLMFDPEAFAFSRTPGFTFADQAEQFRRLNNMVLNAGVATGVREYIDGLYAGNAAVPNAPAHPEFVPPAWKTTREDEAMYRNVIAPSCRGCHATYQGAKSELQFATPAAFRAVGTQIAEELCGDATTRKTHGMPNAEVVRNKMLAGPGRAMVVDFLGIRSACVH